MHQPISILTHAAKHAEAREAALEFADRLIDEGDYDSYDGESAKTYRLASLMGRKAVELALQRTRRAFDDAMKAARLMLQHFTDEQIFQEDFGEQSPTDHYASRYQFAILGGMTPDCYLYGDETIWGEKMQNDRDYDAAMKDRDPNEVWVTVLDMHHQGGTAHERTTQG